jgi:DNA-binding response OmpR family regulator
VDIRLPDLDGCEIFRRLREIQPQTPIILMTGFGYDPTHSIVKARQEGLQTVLYKPFRSDRLMEAVEMALRSASSGQGSRGATAEGEATRSGSPPPASSAAPPPVSSSAVDAGEPGSPPAFAAHDGPQGEPRPTEVSRHES